MHFDFERYVGIDFWLEMIRIFLSTFSPIIIIILLLYILLMIYFYLKGTDKEKIFFVWYPIVLIIVLLNPWMSWLWTKFFNMHVRFFREFWLLPVILTFSYFFTKHFNKYKKTVFVVIVMLTVLGAYTVVNDTRMLYVWKTENVGLMPVDNIWKVPDEIIELSDIIESKSEGDWVYALCDEDVYRDIHTYNARINVMCLSKDSYEYSYNDWIYIAETYGISCLIVPKDACAYNDFVKDSGYIGETNHYAVIML